MNGGGYNGRGYYGGWDDGYRPGAALAVGAAAVAAIGSIAYTMPTGCGQVAVNGMSYYQCGSTWYQPQYAGSDVQYVVVNAPQ